jgi:hypothetical protein
MGRTRRAVSLGAGAMGVRRERAMKRLLLVLMTILLADALAGCIVVPEHAYTYRPAHVYVY